MTQIIFDAMCRIQTHLTCYCFAFLCFALLCIGSKNSDGGCGGGATAAFAVAATVNDRTRTVVNRFLIKLSLFVASEDNIKLCIYMVSFTFKRGWKRVIK